MRQIPPGTKGTFTLRVEPAHLANQFKDAMLPQVLATPVMILTMENAALNAITKDQGWIEFAAKSDWIYTEQDLAAGLEMLQDDAEIARGIVTNFLNRMENGEESAALERFRSDIKYEVGDLMPNADGNSGFHMDTRRTQ